MTVERAVLAGGYFRARLSMMLTGTIEVWAPAGSTEDVVSNAVVPPRNVWLSLIRQLASA